ncbi:MAG TPA: DNA polymerase I, partial [bacterium]|nr:DNA polymerase I [bacterium]
GFVETLYGRKRDTSGLRSSNFRVKAATEREVINFPIQGTAADQIKLAMVGVDSLIKENSGIKMLLQVHDELIFELKTDKKPADVMKQKKSIELIEEIREIMLESAKLDVPMDVDVNIGKNWGELK